MVGPYHEESEELADAAVSECYICGPMDKWTQTDIPKGLRSFLMELWYYHEDLNDNIQCYYALERARNRNNAK